MARGRRVILPLAVSAVVLALTTPGAGAGPWSWPWPVVGPIIRGFEPPATPYSAGHRGIDIAVAYGTPIASPAPGIVKFAGPVGGELFVSVDHGGGIVSTYSWIAGAAVRKGDALLEGSILGFTGFGHPGTPIPHLHFGVKLNGVYIDPLSMLSSPSVVDLIRLAPLTMPGGV